VNRWARGAGNSNCRRRGILIVAGHQQSYTITSGGPSGEDQRKLSELFAQSSRSRILCLTRVLPTGADRINEALHQKSLRNGEFGDFDNLDLVPGEPVMMQVNDYRRMLFNGDQGIILNVLDGHQSRTMAVFPRSDSFIAFPVKSLRLVLVYSYAMTVHKSQGSEFERMALILPDRDLSINTREILYTALTRRRSSATIIGARNIFNAGIGRAIARDSGIADKLRARLRAE
jgi:exodeoxyribonuclease V alpha subunit